MRVWINPGSVGLVQSVNIKEGRFCCLTVENISFAIMVDLLSSRLTAVQPSFSTLIWIACDGYCKVVKQKLDTWSYLGGSLWYCWLHCKSHPRLHPTWSQVKSHYPIKGNQLSRRVMSRYISIHSSQVRTWITISAAENVWKGTVTYW